MYGSTRVCKNGTDTQPDTHTRTYLCIHIERHTYMIACGEKSVLETDISYVSWGKGAWEQVSSGKSVFETDHSRLIPNPDPKPNPKPNPKIRLVRFFSVNPMLYIHIRFEWIQQSQKWMFLDIKTIIQCCLNQVMQLSVRCMYLQWWIFKYNTV